MTQFIIVLGMAHSGTTILARTLSQHPDIDTFVKGREAIIYENEALIQQTIEPINSYAQKTKKGFILMKKPFYCHKNEFLINNFIDAHYLYIQKEKEDIFKSWSRPNSHMFEDGVRICVDVQHKKYDEHFNSSKELEQTVKNFTRIQHKELCENPELMFNTIVEKTGLNPFQFNLREIKEKIDIKEMLKQKFIFSRSKHFFRR